MADRHGWSLVEKIEREVEAAWQMIWNAWVVMG